MLFYGWSYTCQVIQILLIVSLFLKECLFLVWFITQYEVVILFDYNKVNMAVRSSYHQYSSYFSSSYSSFSFSSSSSSSSRSSASSSASSSFTQNVNVFSVFNFWAVGTRWKMTVPIMIIKVGHHEDWS